jgi:hypothetical protein
MQDIKAAKITTTCSLGQVNSISDLKISFAAFTRQLPRKPTNICLARHLPSQTVINEYA